MTAADVEPPWWTPRKSATPRRALSREAIVATALDVLRAEGMDAVSMRRVAADLGTGPASLYAHVAGKDELLDLLYDEVVGAIPLPTPDPQRWQEQVTRLWSDCRDALAGARDIARYSLGRVPMGPNALRVSEVTIRGAGRRPLPVHRSAGAPAHDGHGGRAVPLRPRAARRRAGRARYRSSSTSSSMSSASCQRPSAERS